MKMPAFPKMNRYRWGLLSVAALIVAAVAVAGSSLGGGFNSPLGATSSTRDPDLIPMDQRRIAPEFVGLQGWLNSSPLTMATLRGRVVLIDFWTYSCINCVNTFPHLRSLSSRYSTFGLVIIGVHSPEFDFEKSTSNVASAVNRQGVTWPVALDPNMETWNAWENQYWPAEYLVDKDGRVAYEHVGEGDYARTELAIVSLLGSASPISVGSPTPNSFSVTPETYAGSSRGQLEMPEQYGQPFAATFYPDPGFPRDPGTIQLVGTWADHLEYLEAVTAGHLRIRFRAHDVYVVAAPAGASPVPVSVMIDGESVQSAQLGPEVGSQGTLLVVRSDLYHVLTGVGDRQHVLDLSVAAGFRIYTLNFE